MVEEFKLGVPYDELIDRQDAAESRLSRLAHMTVEHEGQLKKLDILIAAVQSSLAAWQNTAIGVAGAIGVVIAVLAGFQVLSFGEISSLRSDTNTKIDALSDKMQNLEVGQKTLPAQLSQELLSMAASVAEIRSGTEAAASADDGSPPRHKNRPNRGHKVPR